MTQRKSSNTPLENHILKIKINVLADCNDHHEILHKISEKWSIIIEQLCMMALLQTKISQLQLIIIDQWVTYISDFTQGSDSTGSVHILLQRRKKWQYII